MRQKIRAGQTIDAVTPDEAKVIVKTALKDWQAENVIGGRFPRFSANATVAAGSISIGGPAGGALAEQLGPEPGFIWDVRRLRISGLLGADVVTAYVNDASPSSVIDTTSDQSTTVGMGHLFKFDRQVVLYPGDALLVIGNNFVATPTGAVITVSGQVLEVPVSQAWRLAG